MHLQWCLLLVLISLSAGHPCPAGPGCETCHKLPNNEFEIICKTSDLNSEFAVHFRPDDWIRIECYNSPNWTEFHLGTIRQIFDVKSISFRRCELPERERLGAIARQLMGNRIKELTFQSREDLTPSLTKGTFSAFKNVERLTLASNGLKNVTSDLLDELKNLQILNLRDNNLRELPQDFLDLPNLRSIELGGNHLEILDASAFSKSTSLQLLNIWNNRLKEIKPNSFDALVSLISLNLHRNHLQKLPKNIFTKLNNLRSINLAQNNFTGDSLQPDLLSNNTFLEEVRFFENRQNLTTLPSKFFAHMKHLKLVNLRRSGILSLPEDLFLGSFALRNLSLAKNYIQMIPRRLFEHCRNLSTLDLAFNDLRHIPDRVFEQLGALELLDLSRNQIDFVSQDMFQGLSALKILSLEKNGLKAIHAQGLAPLQDIRILKFSFNQLTLLTPQAMFDDDFGYSSPFHDCMDTVEELHLAHNNISEILSEWRLATELRKLDLRNNNVQFLQASDFNFFSDGIEIDLSSNHIETVLLHTLDIFSQRQEHKSAIKLSIENNPISCDCNLYDLLRYQEHRMHPIVHDRISLKMSGLKCNKPDYLSGMSIDKLQSESLTCLAEEPILMRNNATCPDHCECRIRPENRAYLIDCSHRSLTYAPRELQGPSGLHIELNLTGNHLTDLPSMNQPGYGSVTVLSVPHNQIRGIPINAISDTLQVLDLESNRLERLNTSVLDTLSNSSLTALNLQGNPWIADCDSRDFLSFVKTRMQTIPDLQKVVFNGSSTPIFEMTPEELCPPIDDDWVIGVCVGLAVLGIVIGSLAAFYYRYQLEIKVWLYKIGWWFVTEDELDRNKLYDAFISYSHKDEAFVVNELMSELESGPKPFKICVHYRDWKAGEWIPTQIANSVEESRRTIVVLSPNFLESVWGKMEFRAAHLQALNEGRARVVVIVFGDIGPIGKLEPELKAYLTMNTYVKWGDPWFWDKLRFAMPHREGARKSIFQGQTPRLHIISDKV